MARRIGTVRRYLVATPAYLRERGTPRTPDDLKQHHCIAYSRLAPANQWTFESDDGRHVVAISGAVTVDDADAMKEAVLQHLGIAIVPAWSATEPLRRGRMRALLPDYGGLGAAAACGLSGDALDVAAGAQLSRFHHRARGAVQWVSRVIEALRFDRDQRGAPPAAVETSFHSSSDRCAMLEKVDKYAVPQKLYRQNGGQFHTMVKPAGSTCNLDCKYCFYLSKETLPNGPGAGAMDDETLELFIRQYIDGNTGAFRRVLVAGRRADAARAGLLPPRGRLAAEIREVRAEDRKRSADQRRSAQRGVGRAS